jgi:HAD superfamily phosphatase (TIGR01668 family)
MIEAVWKISPQRLRQEGIRALILDLDNTLVDWNEEHLRPEVTAWALDCRKAGLSLCVCTNARCKPRVRNIASEIGACYLSGAGKPAAKAWRRALWLLHCRTEQAVVVGDQVFTDVWGANRLGMKTILVRPLSTRDFFATKIPRLFERRLLSRWRAEGKVFQQEY